MLDVEQHSSTGEDVEARLIPETARIGTPNPMKACATQKGKLVLATLATLIVACVATTKLLKSSARPFHVAFGGTILADEESADSTNANETKEDESPCTKSGDDCSQSKCCKDAGHMCFQKNPYWATCRPSCTPGLDENDPSNEPWSCKVLGVQEMWDYNENRMQKLLGDLTLDEKVSLLRGQNDDWPADRHGYAGYVALGKVFLDDWQAKGFLPLSMNDGPQGFNSYGISPSTSTQLPCLLAVAASFDPEVSSRYASAIADEFVGKGANVLLGPDVEVTRSVLTGRSFETISGEDPFLGSSLVQPFIKAVQDHGVIATPKHWLDNNQEIYRLSMNVEVDDRAQHEIYMPVFKAAFDAGAAAVMCSYNKVYGTFACENDKLLKKLLREDLGFRGFVVSDWGATHNAENSARAGLDIDMQTTDPTRHLPDEFHKLPELVEQGKVSEERITEMAGHVLAAGYMVGHFDGRFAVKENFVGANVGDQRGAVDEVLMQDVTTDEHRAVAHDTIVSSAVLLKNEGVLPLTPGEQQKVVMVGKYCKQDKDESYGQGSVFSGGGSGFVETDNTKTLLEGLQEKIQDVTWSPDASGAEGADVAIVCAAGHSEEGWDRENLTLPQAWDLVSGLRSLNGGKDMKIVMLAVVPGAVETDWKDKVDAILVLFMPGEQVGPAVARLLIGEANPGGRLPVSFPESGEKRFASKQYPGECPPPKTWCSDMTAQFSEGVLVGYRWNNAMKVSSAYPFGFGLDYTDFKFDNFKSTCDGTFATVSLTVSNTGGRDGHAVPQLYVGFKSLKPVLRQLRGFRKVFVPTDKDVAVAFALTDEDWRYFDEGEQRWVTAIEKSEPITVYVGTSSANLVWQSELNCEATKKNKANHTA